MDKCPPLPEGSQVPIKTEGFLRPRFGPCKAALPTDKEVHPKPAGTSESLGTAHGNAVCQSPQLEILKQEGGKLHVSKAL